MARSGFLWLVAFLFLFSGVAAAEEEKSGLEQRVEELERQLAAQDDEPDEEVAGAGLGLVYEKGNIVATLQIFGDVGWTYTDPEPANRSSNSFFLGSMSFFFSGRVGDHFTVVSETVLKASAGAQVDNVRWDQERLWGSWAFSDALYVKIGLEHNAISRWNRQYHHGRYLEISVTRPYMARFESSGFMPMHNAGVELGGQLPLGQGIFEWIFIVSNGRGRVPTDPQKVSDKNGNKAVDLNVSFLPTVRAPGLRFGAHIRYEELPNNPAGTPARPQTMDELVVTTYIEYRHGPWYILAEGACLTNEDNSNGVEYAHYAGYIQIAYQIDDTWTPYARIDYFDGTPGDPYFAPFNRDLDRTEAVLGIRMDFVSNAAMKLDVGYGEAQFRDGAGVITRDDFWRISFQLAWVF